MCPAGIVYNITGGPDMTLQDVNRISEVRGQLFEMITGNKSTLFEM